jgi:hypothetical protein
MKNFTLLFLFVLLMNTTANAQVSLGVRGGITIADLIFERSGKSMTAKNTDHLNTGHADLLFNIPIYGQLYLQPLIRYVTKGARFQTLEGPKPANIFESATDKIRIHYLELPLNIVYKFPMSFGKITAGLGPYVAYGIAGRYNTAIQYNGSIVQESYQNIEFSNGASASPTDMRLRRWEGGANFMVGIEFNNALMLGVNYGYGLTDLDKSVNTTVKNRYIGISMGFLLNREDW